MKQYIIEKYGRRIREIIGNEVDLLHWIRDNVPPVLKKTAIRGTDVLCHKKPLYEDAKAANLEITIIDIGDGTKKKYEGRI